jgi:hypothetical protein
MAVLALASGKGRVGKTLAAISICIGAADGVLVPATPGEGDIVEARRTIEFIQATARTQQADVDAFAGEGRCEGTQTPTVAPIAGQPRPTAAATPSPPTLRPIPNAWPNSCLGWSIATPS